MKLVTYEDPHGAARIGALFDGDARIADFAAGHGARNGASSPWFGDMLALIDGGNAALDLAREVLEIVASGDVPDAAVDVPLAKLLSPVPVPRQIRACIAFEKHLLHARQVMFRQRADASPDPEATWKKFQEEGAMDIPAPWYERPLYYMTNRFSVVGTDADVVWPRHSELIDYELEFGVFIGKGAKDVPRERAGEHIFGYSIFNDMSARDIQTREMGGQLGPHKGKNFDTGNPIGPWIVTPDEIDDVYDLTMTARVNGEEFSRGSTSEMYYTFEDIIADASRDETIYPGEFIASGTVGTGSGVEYDRYLKEGDIVELEVDGLGILRNRLVRP